MSPSVKLQRMLQKGIFKDTSVGDVLVLNSGQGSIRAIRTKSAGGSVLNATFITGHDVDDNPITQDFPLNGALPADIAAAQNAEWYAQGHPVVEEMATMLDGITAALATLQAHCAGNTEALTALNNIRNQYGF